MPRSSLLLTAAIGIALGVGFAFVTGAIVAGSYDVSLGTDDSDQQTVLNSLSVLAIPILAAVLMLTPAVVMRFVRPGTRESLDGFVIGAWGAISFTAAATLTRLAPQLETGVTAWDRPVSILLVEAGIQGMAIADHLGGAGRPGRRCAVVGPQDPHRLQCACGTWPLHV